MIAIALSLTTTTTTSHSHMLSLMILIRQLITHVYLHHIPISTCRVVAHLILLKYLDTFDALLKVIFVSGHSVSIAFLYPLATGLTIFVLERRSSVHLSRITGLLL